AALPGAPPPIAGLTAHRGELLPLLDIRANLGLQPTALDDLGRIVVLRDDETRAGVFVDGVEGLRNIRTSELSPPPDRGTADRNLFRGITPDILALLDARAILRLFAGGDDS